VVHRDIKPANIMRTPAGTVKLMDFGIARMQADRQLTKTGTTVGSLFYMSPEQINGGQPDSRSDLYSLGVTLYEMVTGRRPFGGDSDYSIMAAHLQKAPVAPMEIVASVPQDLNDIILMAITKDPEQRFQSADAFHAALRNFGGSMGVALGGVKTAPTPLPHASLQSQTPTAKMTSIAPELPPTATGISVPAASRPSVAPGPPPVVQAAPAPPPPQSKSGSRRGLYMALGSVATLLVLAAAIIEGPKLMHSGASSAAPKEVESTPVAAAPSSSTAPSSPPAASSQPAASSPIAAPQDASTPPPGQPAAAAPTTPVPTAAPQAQVRSTPVQKQARSQAPPQQSGQQPPQSQQPPQQSQQTPQQQAPARPSGAELNELRQQYNQVAIRVGAAKSGLRALQQQMQRQGVDLRGDMLEAESRMDYLMKESMDSMRAGDADSSRTSLQMAERSLETIEKFLGR
jgi:serine/threonine-protein kinase